MVGEGCLIPHDGLPLCGRHLLCTVHPSSEREARGTSHSVVGETLYQEQQGQGQLSFSEAEMRA